MLIVAHREFVMTNTLTLVNIYIITGQYSSSYQMIIYRAILILLRTHLAV